MNFIALVKFKGKPDRDLIAVDVKQIEAESKDRIRYMNICWPLGQFDTVVLIEARDDKAAMKVAVSRADWADIGTLAAVPAEEARKLVG